jgi:predicted lipoprotein
MPPTRRLVLFGLGAGLASPHRARAQGGDGPDRRAIAIRIARGVLIPGYRTFAEATAAEAAAWEAFRARPDAAGVAALRQAFEAAADAWSGIEALRGGPIAVENRFERVAHWPERRNAVGRAVAGLLEETGELTPERLRRASVAGQGLTALERLLYGETEGGAGKAADDLMAPAGERRRALGAAIAGNLREIGAETLAGWTGSGGEAASYERASPEEAREILTRLATDQLAQIEAVEETKIGTVLGKGPDEARPLLAEGWRSGRSLRAIALNLAAAEAFTRAALAHEPERLRAVEAGSATARSVADGLAGSGAALGTLAADRRGRARLVLLRDAVASARTLCGPAYAEALGVTIGFNSRDGD